MKILQSKAVYQAFEADKQAIKQEFGGQLDWYESPENKESYICVSLEDADFRQQSDLHQQFEWLASNIEKLDRLFRKRVKKL